MLVYFEELPLAGRDFVWQLLTLDEDCGCEPDGPLEARCHVQPAGPGRATIEGRLSGTVLLQCDRCLRAYPFRLDAPFLVRAVAPGVTGKGIPADAAAPICEASDLDLIELDSPCVELEALMREQLLLSLPEKRLCRDSCAGLCPYCGASRDDQPCDCGQKNTVSAFAALAGPRLGKTKNK